VTWRLAARAQRAAAAAIFASPLAVAVAAAPGRSGVRRRRPGARARTKAPERWRVHRIADWSHLTNAHVVPGPGIIAGLAQVGRPKGRGLLLLAEMSSAGTLAAGGYTDAAVAMALANPEFATRRRGARRVKSAVGA
jgi:hypothetical protein